MTALQWCDANLPAGSYFADWTPFEHPQLGSVEIGGWSYKFVVICIITRSRGSGVVCACNADGLSNALQRAVAESAAVSS